MVEPIKLKSNEFWGRKGGTIHPIMGPVFKLKRKGLVGDGNKGPTGWKLKKAPRRYANRRLRRQGRL